jgi:hypothetical protein
MANKIVQFLALRVAPVLDSSTSYLEIIPTLYVNMDNEVVPLQECVRRGVPLHPRLDRSKVTFRMR